MEPRLLVYTSVVEPDLSRRLSALKDSGAKKAFATLEEALQADPDQELFEAVDIMVPNVGTLHEEVALIAQKANRHILLEKPISVCIASGQRILQSQGPEKVLAVAENAQYWREVVEAQRLIQSGAIGDVLTVRAKFWESAHPALNEWAADGSYEAGSFIADAAEGFVFDGGLHWLRPLRMFLGKAQSVSAVAGRALPHMRGPGMTQALICFECGVTAVFEAILAPGAISEQPFFVIQGTKGEVVLDGFAGGGRIYCIQDGKMMEQDINRDYSGPVGWDTGYAGEMRDFALAIRQKTALAAAPHEALEDLRLMLAIMRAAKTRQWQVVADVDPELDMESLQLQV
ncbi:unnamed protein product [Durusdinium trenchii]